MIRPSLNRRLVLRLVTGIALVWFLASAWMAWRMLHEVDEIFDQTLVRTAASVLAVMPASPGQDAPSRLPNNTLIDSDPDAQRPAITLRTAAGDLLLQNRLIPLLTFSSRDEHFHTYVHAERRWRVFQRWDTRHQYWIQVAAPLDERDELMLKMIAPAVLALLALLVLVPPTVFIGLRGGLKPLRHLTSRLTADGSARIPVLTEHHVPIELAPFTEAIDQLVTRLQESLERERRFTADAAHELRHPLAALRLELDLAAGSDGVEDRALHLQRSQAALDRMQRLVTQLLTLARVENLTEFDDAHTVSLAAVVEEALRAVSERAAQRAIQLSLDTSGDTRVHASAGMLGILVHNLLDNALRHTPEHGQIAVRVDADTESVILEVDDNGPGFATADVDRLVERFHRSVASIGEGSGLGLSVSQAIARLHHGRLEFGRATLGGARVRLFLPRTHAATHANGAS